MSFKKYIVLCGNHLVNYFSLSMIYWMPQIQEKASISIQNLPMFFIAIVKMSTGRDIRLLRVNKDKKIDLSVANYNDDTISVLFGNGDGTFQNMTVYPTGTSPTCIISGDFNNDNKPDLAIINEQSNDISVFLNVCSS